MTGVSILDLSQMGDPIPSHEFDVMLGDKPWVEVAAVKATSKLLKLTFVPLTKSKLIDLSGRAVTVRLYQTLADKDIAQHSFMSVKYHLKKLQGIHLNLDGATFSVLPVQLVQVYEIERVEFF